MTIASYFYPETDEELLKDPQNCILVNQINSPRFDLIGFTFFEWNYNNLVLDLQGFKKGPEIGVWKLKKMKPSAYES
jgi:hypothetical protein